MGVRALLAIGMGRPLSASSRSQLLGWKRRDRGKSVHFGSVSVDVDEGLAGYAQCGLRRAAASRVASRRPSSPTDDPASANMRASERMESRSSRLYCCFCIVPVGTLQILLACALAAL